MKKLMSMLLVTVLLCGCMMPVAYADSAIQPRDSNYFSSYGTTLSNEGEGVIKITFSTTGIKINNSIGVSSYLVEKLDDDGNWEDVTGLLSGETGSGVMSYTYSKYFNGVVG